MDEIALETQNWLRFAAEDLRIAELVIKENMPRQVCFHAQQCVEKMLKILLIQYGQRFSKLHDLNELYSRCIDTDIQSVLPFQKEIASLNLYYAVTYPDYVMDILLGQSPTDDDAQLALDAAITIYNQLRKGLLK